MPRGEEQDGDYKNECLRVKLGPFSEDMLMSMAALTHDYHPLQLLHETASGKGLPGLRLHEAWLGGLVDLGLKALLGEVSLSLLAISYVKYGYQSDTLMLELMPGNECQPDAGVGFHFKIVNQRGKVIAKGTACCGR
jgi:hypothetical protein